MMAAVLTTLREGFGGRLEVEFVNAGRDQSLKAKYGVSVLPTQIYYSSEGKELYRHAGFASEENIIKKWKDLGYDLMAEPKRKLPPENAPDADDGV
jgi:thioredoxin 1